MNEASPLPPPPLGLRYRQANPRPVSTMMSEVRDTSTLEGGIDANRGGEVIACAVIFIVSCTLFLALRFLSYRLADRNIFFEDWLIIPAYILMMGICATVICSMLALPISFPYHESFIHLLTCAASRRHARGRRSTPGVGADL